MLSGAPDDPQDSERWNIERRARESGQPLQIGFDVWIGGGAIVLPGVTIESRTVIGAGSVVTRDIRDDVFAAGNPCRVVRRLGGRQPGTDLE